MIIVATSTPSLGILGHHTSSELTEGPFNFTSSKRNLLVLMGGFTLDNEGESVATLDIEILGLPDLIESEKKNEEENVKVSNKNHQCWSIPE